jgi:hypothetical protein
VYADGQIADGPLALMQLKTTGSRSGDRDTTALHLFGVLGVRAVHCSTVCASQCNLSGVGKHGNLLAVVS